MGVYVSVICFVAYLVFLFMSRKKGKSFNFLVMAGLIGGIVFGAIMRAVLSPEAITGTLRWTSLVGSAYTNLLKMMVIPLVFVSIVCSIINQKGGKDLGKTAGIVLAVLLGTAAIAAIVGCVTALGFGVSAEGLEIGEAETAKMATLESKAASAQSFEQTLLSIIPSNPIYALTGQGSNATLSTVLVAVFFGVGLMGVRTYAPEEAETFTKLMNSLNTLVVEVVMMIIMLTPYGVFSLMIKTVAGSDLSSVLRLVTFLVASYVAIIAMFIIHGLLLAVVGLNPVTYFKKAFTTLVFAFTSRTSAGTLPMTIKTLTNEMGVDSGVANLAGSLGTSIGQNGCAAIYPAIVVMMVAPVVGQPITLGFIIKVVVVITVASVGIAGVGGGATFAGITVLSALGMPVGIAGLLVGIEPLIDMGRTALNVSDGMVTALIAGKITDKIDTSTYNKAAEK